jgi:hypothetical protein
MMSRWSSRERVEQVVRGLVGEQRTTRRRAVL